MAKKYSPVCPKITSPSAEIQCSLESAYLPGIVLTVSVASIFSRNQSKAFVRLSRLAFDCWLVTQTKNSKLL